MKETVDHNYKIPDAYLIFKDGGMTSNHPNMHYDITARSKNARNPWNEFIVFDCRNKFTY